MNGPLAKPATSGGMQDSRSVSQLPATQLAGGANERKRETNEGVNRRTINSFNPLLKDVSRSFYLTLRVLPRKVRRQIGLAYLLARTTDTIADTELVPVERRLDALHALRARILGLSEHPLDFSEFTSNCSSRRKEALNQKSEIRNQKSEIKEAERVLLEKCEAAIALLSTLSAADKKLVQAVLDTITSGQELDLRRFTGASAERIIALRTDDELDDYTYRVAGCVGEFWTKICRAHLFPRAALDEARLVADGVRFGKGLQLENILR